MTDSPSWHSLLMRGCLSFLRNVVVDYEWNQIIDFHSSYDSVHCVFS